MFRTSQNVPEYYVNKSRDFQLLCNIKDLIINSTKYSIDSLRHTSNTMEVNNKLLPLLKTKLGFMDSDELTEDQLRILLTGFPYLLKNKGSKKAISEAINLWFRLNQTSGRLISIDIKNEEHLIQLNLESVPIDTNILSVMLTYIIPTGYLISYNFTTAVSSKDPTKHNDYVQGLLVPTYINSRAREEIPSDSLKDRLIGAVGFTNVVTKEDYNKYTSEVSSTTRNAIYPINNEEENQIQIEGENS